MINIIEDEKYIIELTISIRCGESAQDAGSEGAPQSPKSHSKTVRH